MTSTMSAALPTAPDAPSTDRIEKHLVLRAPQARVWHAIATAEALGAWFRMTLDGAIAEGAALRGRLTHPGYEHVTVDLHIVHVEPERYLAYRWHPGAVDMRLDYSAEPTTLVEFTLAPVDGGTAVTIVESGFDALPAARRADAFRMNTRGWDGQAQNLTRYVDGVLDGSRS